MRSIPTTTTTSGLRDACRSSTSFASLSSSRRDTSKRALRTNGSREDAAFTSCTTDEIKCITTECFATMEQYLRSRRITASCVANDEDCAFTSWEAVDFEHRAKGTNNAPVGTMRSTLADSATKEESGIVLLVASTRANARMWRVLYPACATVVASAEFVRLTVSITGEGKPNKKRTRTSMPKRAESRNETSFPQAKSFFP